MAIALGILFALLATIGWGLSDFFAKNAIDRIGGYKTYFYFNTIATIMLIIVFFFFPRFSKLSLFLIVLFVLEAFLSFLGYLFLYKGMETEKVSIMSPIAACYPIVVVLLSFFLLKEILNLNQIIAFILMISGLILISIKKGIHIGNKKGIYLAFLAMLSFGFVVFLLGYLIKSTNWIFALMFGRILSWLFIFNFFKIKKMSFSIGKSIIPILILTAISEVGGDVFFAFGVNVSLISLVAVISSLYPLIVIILARIFYKERLNIYQKIGSVVILIGLVLISL